MHKVSAVVNPRDPMDRRHGSPGGQGWKRGWAKGWRMRVLLIGGCKLLVKALKQGLEEEGFTVDVSHKDREENCKPAAVDHDAIVLDLERPEAAGLSRLQRWRRDGLLPPILVLTVPNGNGDSDHRPHSWADDWLAKPFDPEELFARVRALVQRT
jgi:two-component system, OmpR family, response regulator